MTGLILNVDSAIIRELMLRKYKEGHYEEEGNQRGS